MSRRRAGAAMEGTRQRQVRVTHRPRSRQCASTGVLNRVRNRGRTGARPWSTTPGADARYAASAYAGPRSGSQVRQAAGIVGLATWMKTWALGAAGRTRGCMPAFSGRGAPFRRLHGAHDAAILSQPEEPPLERGMTWSTVRLDFEPQYWHVHPSRAK